MDDPLITNKFIRKILKIRKSEIIGLAKAKGNRLKTFKKSKLEYLFCLFWILGPFIFIKNAIISLIFKIELFLLKQFNSYPSNSILYYCRLKTISSYEVSDVNSSSFLSILKDLNPDIIINQSQQILGKEIISIPKHGIINRHNSLLPKHRGRITPFWVLLNEDKETGVSIHYVNEGLDEGEILYQFSYLINGKNFNQIVETNYRIAPLAMLKALENIEKNKSYKAPIRKASNYNSTPLFEDLVRFLKIKYG
tara:strand:+ start:1517 stop:2272 length:756 start_codon:yes stop_codon:yes gene_type:complete